ncbi:hypothetical protein FOL47_004760 [Perkinsus chesapeaki]|uniref:WW domain-containing protein n=1 Tax=Perkinsus chesapeaki TaxID=330153 RepID=A0A7J6MZD6_PERCH|nr:hypothetical protein FOL47_004760 [Perkinsus chesapeaki]
MAATAATAKAQATVLGKIVGLSSGKTQQIPEEPTEQEIEDYALWLGLDKVKDRDLFWIAKQALRTPIPQPWVQCQTASGDVFFHNTKTKESVWDHPYDQYYQQAVEQYKNGKSSREELAARVSQSWLFSNTDQRSSAQVSPEPVKGKPKVSINYSTTSSRLVRDDLYAVADESPSRIVAEIELPEDRVVEAVGRIPDDVIVEKSPEKVDQLGDFESEISAGARADDLLDEIDPCSDLATPDGGSNIGKKLFEPPPRNVEATLAELAELKVKLAEVEEEKGKAERDLKESEKQRERLQRDHDATVESLSSARETKDASIAELEKIEDELKKEKEAREKAEAQLVAQAASNRLVVEELAEQLEEVKSRSEDADGFIASQAGEIEMLRDRLKDGREKVRVLAEEDVARRQLLLEKDAEVVSLNRTVAAIRQQLHAERKRSKFSKLCGRTPTDMSDAIVQEEVDVSVDVPEQNRIFEELLTRVLAQPPPVSNKPAFGSD